MEGTLSETVISEQEARHYAEDAGKNTDEILSIRGEQKGLFDYCGQRADSGVNGFGNEAWSLPRICDASGGTDAEECATADNHHGRVVRDKKAGSKPRG